jgi:hypothetical protein
MKGFIKSYFKNRNKKFKYITNDALSNKIGVTLAFDGWKKILYFWIIILHIFG